MALFARTLNIYGWERLEASVLACLVIQQPILLYGAHGLAKTEGLSRLLRALLQDNSKVAEWNVAALQFRHLLGFLNPKRLARGDVDYIPTPLSIWGKQAVIFDELLAGNQEVMHEILEIVRTRKIQGLETEVEYVVAATNPPGGKYDLGYGQLPLIDRFVALEAPEPSDDVLPTILRSPKYTGEHSLEIKTTIDMMRSGVEEPTTADMRLVTDLSVLCKVRNVGLSIRKACVLLQLLAAARALPSSVQWDEDSALPLLLGCLPEVTGLCRPSSAGAGSIKAAVQKLLDKYFESAPAIVGPPQSLADACQADRTNPHWLTCVQEATPFASGVECFQALASLRNIEGTIVDSARSFISLGLAQRLKQEHGRTPLTPNALKRAIRKVPHA